MIQGLQAATHTSVNKSHHTKIHQHTLPECLLNSRSCCLLAASHTRTLPSSDADSTVAPSAATQTADTVPVCPSNTRIVDSSFVDTVPPLSPVLTTWACAAVAATAAACMSACWKQYHRERTPHSSTHSTPHCSPYLKDAAINTAHVQALF